MKVRELAQYVRSKNAGPFWVSVEIFCNNDAAYETIKKSPNITSEKIAALYGTRPDLIKEFYIDNLRVVKFSYPSPGQTHEENAIGVGFIKKVC
jgi:hypothetical protein